ncbi:response regulator transcription factor [Lysobacter niabensis]|uniref:response regulator n=1 Tax=Agrilutibacter niabensis TaxID=380628 RepID=UPI00361BCA06
MGRCTVVVAEDHPAVAAQLRELLAHEFEVAAVVGDGQALVEAVQRLSPQVAVTDISMPGTDGIDATRLLLKTNPRTRVILLTVHHDLNLVRQGLLAGCSGYVLKSSAGEELLMAIDTALQGGTFLSAELAPPDVLDELMRRWVRKSECPVTGVGI